MNSTYERGPAKRKIKPVEGANLLDFDLEESSDDSDFRIEDHAEESDDYSLDSDDAGRNKNDDDDEEEDDDDDESDDSTLGLTKGKGGSASQKQLQNLTVSELLAKARCDEDVKNKIAGLLDMLICAGCLGSRSDDSNEIVECDGCGITVHEACYGVSDVASESSTVSSASTEPWFCEACKAGVTDPTCELCPNTGGIFKETEVGAWVHLVCALYVPGVAFSEVDKLSGVTLFEMPYSKWGARACCLCEDETFSRTGICIGCDAGMCRTYFHVTCGQREGLLAEIHMEEAEQADPFYAHCKLHSDKTLIKKRKRNWLALQLRTSQRLLDIENNRTTSIQVRNMRKLEKYRKKFTALKETKSAPWVPTQKMPRLLPTSATACRKFLQKANLMGIDIAALELQDAQIAALTDIKKKWHIPPAFSVEFIGYYLERNTRMEAMKKSLQELIDNNAELISQQKGVREEYDNVGKENNDVNEELSSIKETISKFHQTISTICPNKVLPNIEGLMASLTTQAPGQKRTMAVPTAAALKMGVGFPLNSNSEDHQGKVLSTSKEAVIENQVSINNECGICRQKTDQHLLAKCDTCHLYYHLGCLKPPLTRLPKKSKLYGWQCSECDKSSDSEAEAMQPKAARRSRTRYSKDGSGLADSLSPQNTMTDEALSTDTKTMKILETKSDNISSLKMKIKTMDCQSHKPVEDVYALPDDSNEGINGALVSLEASRPPKRDKKSKKSKLKGSDNVGIEGDNATSKKSRKRSFNSTLVDAAPLPDENINQTENSDPVLVTAPLTSSQLSSDASFLSPNSTFSMAVNCTPNLETPAFENAESAPFNEEHQHKSNRKRRKEKHRSRYSPDLLKSPSKSHKHKRKKKSLDMDTSEFPRITIKIKPIPKPEGSIQPQLFYVPTDSNDGPPPALLKKQAKQKRVSQEEPPVSFSPPSEVDPLTISSENVTNDKIEQSAKAKKWTRGTKISGDTQDKILTPRKATGAGTPNPPSSGNETLTQCDVCSAAGTHLNLVRCDMCAKRYHFTCLEPPLNKNPKKRGYIWHCADCDPTETESN